MTQPSLSLKFFLDANISPEVERQLNWAFRRHKFRSARSENLLDSLDLDLFPELRARHFDAIITLDRMQMRVPEEAASLRENGLHWIGIKQTSVGGPAAIANLAATILAVVPHFLNDSPREPTAYYVSPFSLKISSSVLL